MNSKMWQIWQSSSLSEKTNIILAGVAIAQAMIYLFTFVPILITMVLTGRAVRATETATVAQIILPLMAEWSSEEMKNNFETLRRHIKQQDKKSSATIMGAMEIEAMQDTSKR